MFVFSFSPDSIFLKFILILRFCKQIIIFRLTYGVHTKISSTFILKHETFDFLFHSVSFIYLFKKFIFIRLLYEHIILLRPTNKVHAENFPTIILKHKTIFLLSYLRYYCTTAQSNFSYSSPVLDTHRKQSF